MLTSEKEWGARSVGQGKPGTEGTAGSYPIGEVGKDP